MSIEVDHSRHVCYFVARIWLLIKCAVNNSINVTGWPVCSQSALHDCAAQLHHGNSVLGTLHVRVIQKSDTFPSAAWTTTSSRRSTISDLLGDRRATVLVRDGKRTEDLQRGCGQYDEVAWEEEEDHVVPQRKPRDGRQADRGRAAS